MYNEFLNIKNLFRSRVYCSVCMIILKWIPNLFWVWIRLIEVKRGPCHVFVKTIVNSWATVTFFCLCRMRPQCAVVPRWSQCGNTPTLPWAARTPSPNTNWSQTPANELGTAATRTMPRPATAPGTEHFRNVPTTGVFDKRANNCTMYEDWSELLSLWVTSCCCVSISLLFISTTRQNGAWPWPSTPLHLALRSYWGFVACSRVNFTIFFFFTLPYYSPNAIT